MIVWVSPKTFTVTQDWFQEEVQLKCKYQPESMKKVVNTQAFSNFHSKQSVMLWKSFQKHWQQIAVWMLSEQLLN